jgi:phosphosulfolactate phosphohydrolase-like enzyme
MDGDDGRSRLRTFLLGGLVGASAVLAAVRRRPQAVVPAPRRGLAAFEDAPCFREQAVKDASSRPR